MMKRYQRAAAWIILFCMACTMTGCGRKSMEKDLQELESEGESGAQDSTESGTDGEDSTKASGQGTLAKKLGIPTEPLSYEVSLDSGEGMVYYVDAEVEAPGVEVVSVCREEMLDVTPKKAAEMAKSLFDAGNYQAVKPYAACTLSELNEIKLSLEKEQQESKPEYIEEVYTMKQRLEDVTFYIDNYMEPMQEYVPGEYYHCQYYEANLTASLKGCYWSAYSDILILEGNIDGEPYQLLFGKKQSDYSTLTECSLSLFRKNPGMIQSTASGAGIGYTYTMGSTTDETEGNECTYTKEEAVRLAEDALRRLGLGDMVPVRTMALDCQRTPVEDVTSEEDYIPETQTDGYIIYLQRNVQGVSSMDIPIGYEWLSADGSSYAKQEQYVVYVSSRGIIEMETDIIYENKETLSDSTELLSFDQIDARAKAAMEAEVEKQLNNASGAEGESGSDIPERDRVKISGVVLRYVTLQYDGKFCLMPVWVYLSTGRDQNYPEVIINAVDGTVVDDNDEVYKCIN